MFWLSSEGERYGFFLAPPCAVLAAYGLVEVGRLLRRPAAIAVAAALVFGPVLWAASVWRPPIVRGYEEAAYHVAGLEGGSSVLIDGRWDGDFVFLSRALAKDGRLVLRGSKILYTFASFQEFGFTSFVESPAEIVEIFSKYGTRYVVIEDPDPERTEAGAMLRELLQTDARFRELASFEIRTDRVGWGANRLRVFEFLESARATAEVIEIYFPGLGGKTIRVPLVP